VHLDYPPAAHVGGEYYTLYFVFFPPAVVMSNLVCGATKTKIIQ